MNGKRPVLVHVVKLRLLFVGQQVIRFQIPLTVNKVAEILGGQFELSMVTITRLIGPDLREIRRAFVRKSHGTENIRRPAETTSVHEAADPAECKTHHQTYRQDVEIQPDPKFVAHKVQKDNQYRKQHSAEKFQAALPDSEDRHKIATELVIMVKDIEHARTNNAGNKRIQRNVGDVIGIFTGFLAQMPHQENT
jgi:hypothetical protein